MKPIYVTHPAYKTSDVVFYCHTFGEFTTIGACEKLDCPYYYQCSQVTEADDKLKEYEGED